MNGLKASKSHNSLRKRPHKIEPKGNTVGLVKQSENTEYIIILCNSSPTRNFIYLHRMYSLFNRDTIPKSIFFARSLCVPCLSLRLHKFINFEWMKWAHFKMYADCSLRLFAYSYCHSYVWFAVNYNEPPVAIHLLLRISEDQFKWV